MADPKLKIAVAEIEAILKKHDIAGIVMLQSPTHLEYLMEVAPSWSCCWFEDYGEAGKLLRFRAKRADFPSKAAHDKVLKESVGMVMGFIDCCNSMGRNLTTIAGKIAEKVEFSHITREEERPPLPPGVEP
jgi:hypothetical protein